MKSNPTIGDVLEAVSEFSTKVDLKFDQIDQRFAQIDQRFNRIEATMVTKDYLDEKLGNVSGKLNVLINVLRKKNVLNEDDKRYIHGVNLS